MSRLSLLLTSVGVLSGLCSCSFLVPDRVMDRSFGGAEDYGSLRLVYGQSPPASPEPDLVFDGGRFGFANIRGPARTGWAIEPGLEFQAGEVTSPIGDPETELAVWYLERWGYQVSLPTALGFSRLRAGSWGEVDIGSGAFVASPVVGLSLYLGQLELSCEYRGRPWFDSWERDAGYFTFGLGLGGTRQSDDG